MIREQYSIQLALEIPGKGHVPMPDAIAVSYNLSPGMRSPFTGYKVVIREPEWDLTRCSHCSTDLLVMPEDSACRFCGVDFRARFSCAKCHTTDDISYKICSECGLITCTLCLAGAKAGPGVLPSECPQCGSEKFQIDEHESTAPSL